MSKAKIGGYIVAASFTIAGITLPYTGWLTPELSKWAFLLSIVGLIIGGAVWLRGRKVSENEIVKITSNENRENKKEQARGIQNNLMNLEKEFWVALDKVSENDNALENIDVKNAMFNLQTETNKLATLVNKREFDEFIEAVLSMYTRYAMFHFEQFRHSVSEMTNREHRKIRMYIRGIKN